MRRQLVIGNWKMNGSTIANQQWVSQFLGLWQGVHRAEVAVAPPVVFLPQLAELLSRSDVALAAQDLSSHAKPGAYTGEVSGAMLADCDCRYVIIGHSERRSYHLESNRLVAEKVIAAFDSGLVPVLCVGESLEQRESGSTLSVIEAQMRAVLDCLDAEQLKGLVVAYEPVWAIGTGKTASPEQAQEVHRFVRATLGEAGSTVRILYGGSVKASSADALFAQEDIDGALVGGAALDAEEFHRICQSAD